MTTNPKAARYHTRRVERPDLRETGAGSSLPFDNEEDGFGLYANPAREAWVTLHEGDIVVTPPEDAHKPGCCEDAPAPLKKICVKVLVD